MSDAQDDLIRARAYAIWQAEGCPNGRHEQHWHQAALELVQAQDEVSAGEPVLAQAGAPEDGAASATTIGASEATPARRTRKASSAGTGTTKGRRKKDA